MAKEITAKRLAELEAIEKEHLKLKAEKETKPTEPTKLQVEQVEVIPEPKREEKAFEKCPNEECDFDKLVKGMKTCPKCERELDWS